MKTTQKILLSAAIITTVLAACRKNGLTQQLPEATVQQDVFAVDYSNTDKAGSQLRATNINNAYAALGRVLFYDTRLSLNGTTSCGSCHKQELSFADNTPTSGGFSNLQTHLNSMAIVNIGRNSGFFWGMRAGSLQTLALMPVSNHREMGFEDLNEMVERVNSIPFYKENMKRISGSGKMSSWDISNALSNFLSSMQSFNSKFDLYRTSNPENEDQPGLTALENKGRDLFFHKYNCATCHSGSSNMSFGWGQSSSSANIGLDPAGTLSGDSGNFKAPTLRNIALTAPYMHDGRFQTLDQVLDHYSSGIKMNPSLSWMFRETNTITKQTQAKKLNITPDEKSALIAFLHCLTDESFTHDKRFSNPFLP